MATSKQVSVVLENKPGRLADVLSALAREKVNLTALAVMDRPDQRVLRVVVDDLPRAAVVLKALGMRFSEADVLVVELRNHPGALAHVCEQLAGGHVNIDYAYCSAGGRNGKTFGVFKVSNIDKASKLLNSSPNDLARRGLGRRPVRDQRSYQVATGNAR